MNKKRFIKIISIFLIVLFTCFSSFQLHKTYSKAVAPLLAIPFGVELLFNLAATAFVTNAVYQMGSEAKKIYDDWQNNKNDDEKKTQYTHWGNELKRSMTSEEVANSLANPLNFVISNATYTKFFSNLNDDRDSNIVTNFVVNDSPMSMGNILLSRWKIESTAPGKVEEYCITNNIPFAYVFAERHGSSWGRTIPSIYLVTGSPDGVSKSIVWRDDYFSFSDNKFCYMLYAHDGPSYSQDLYSYSNALSSNNFPFPTNSYIRSLGGNLCTNSIAGYGNLTSEFYILRYFGDINVVPDTSEPKKEISVEQPDLEIKPNPNYDSTVSVSIPITEISPEQLTESPYKENASSFEYPDAFESTVNDTEINNELNKNPINEGNDGLLDYGDTVNLDFSPLYGAVEDKFPFCIPFDLFHAIDTLTAEKEKPEFTITFPSVSGSKPTSFTFNFDDYEFVIEIFRYFVLLAFCIGLVINTKKILGGS